VQPTTYGLDNSCQLDAMRSLASDARAVAVVDHMVSASELHRLTDAGVRGARFHMLTGGSVDWSSLPEVASRIAEVGWHIQLQLDGHELGRRLEVLESLPVPLVIDHVGRFMPPVPVDHSDVDALRRLVDNGDTWVKLSAPYESAPDAEHRYELVGELARALVTRAPERMLWATNWPHPGQSDPPTVERLAELLLEWIPNATTRTMVLVDNPAVLYGFDD
jgi:D-galactarolactone isomerase